jgi:mannosyl-oligosaccharide glucosidase
LFPLALELIPKDSPKLNKLFQLIQSPDHLWTNFGIRSLSKSDPYYGTGDNYWKGPIWININYLLLSALHRTYRNSPNANIKNKASQIYSTTRTNILQNVMQVYKKTGFLWEQFNPETGQGQRCHPFAGWTTLVLLLQHERY